MYGDTMTRIILWYCRSVLFFNSIFRANDPSTLTYTHSSQIKNQVRNTEPKLQSRNISHQDSNYFRLPRGTHKSPARYSSPARLVAKLYIYVRVKSL